MPYAVYKVIHYLGIFALLTVLAAALGRGAGGPSGTGRESRASGEAEPGDESGSSGSGDDPWRKRFAALHGTALFLILLGGFGMLARIGVEHGQLFPGWVWGKLTVWVLLGGALVAARRSPRWSVRLLFVAPLLAALAGYLAFVKPF